MRQKNNSKMTAKSATILLVATLFLIALAEPVSAAKRTKHKDTKSLNQMLRTQHKNTEILDTLLLLCKQYPKFSKGCRNLPKIVKEAADFMNRVRRQGYKNWKAVHDHCKKVNYKDIFGLCKDTTKLGKDLDGHLASIVEAILKLSLKNDKDLKLGKGVYSHCKKAPRHPLCRKIVMFGQSLTKLPATHAKKSGKGKGGSKKGSDAKKGAKKKKEKPLLTGVINSLCSKIQAQICYENMQRLAQATSKVIHLKKEIKREILQKDPNRRDFEERAVTQLAMMIPRQKLQIHQKSRYSNYCRGGAQSTLELCRKVGLGDQDQLMDMNAMEGGEQGIMLVL